MTPKGIFNVHAENEELGSEVIRIVSIEGTITASNSLEINNKLKKIFQEAHYDTIIDITRLDYIDSKGIAMLLTLNKTVKENGCTLLLTSSSEFIQSLFELTDLNNYFTSVENVEKGREYFIQKHSRK